MIDLINKLTGMVNSVFDVFLYLVIGVAILAIAVTVVQAFIGDDQDKYDKLKRIGWILLFVIIAAAARGLVNWAFGI